MSQMIGSRFDGKTTYYNTDELIRLPNLEFATQKVPCWSTGSDSTIEPANWV